MALQCRPRSAGDPRSGARQAAVCWCKLHEPPFKLDLTAADCVPDLQSRTRWWRRAGGTATQCHTAGQAA